MTESTRIIGPRGWAVLVLAGGAALSAPFLRNPGDPPQSAGSAGKPLEVDFSKKSWPDVREKALTPAGQVASNLSEQDWAELERLKAHPGAAPRKVTGNLPSTTPLPSWADRGPRIDQLVNESIRTVPLAPAAPVPAAGLEPLRPWMGTGLKTNQESPSTAQQADLAGDYSLRTANPDARWHTVPSASTNAETLPQDSTVLAGNRPVRKFEDQVKQWPDEKLSPSQVAWDPPRTQSFQSTQSFQNAAGANTSWSQSSGFPVAGPTNSSPPTTQVFPVAPLGSQIGSPTAQPDMVSAPMVSSQSGRQAPRPSNPTIEAPKAPSTSPRPKHFIQQPAKRA